MKHLLSAMRYSLLLLSLSLALPLFAEKNAADSFKKWSRKVTKNGLEHCSHERVNSKKACNASYNITCKDFKNSRGNTKSLIIRKPGTYRLCEKISYAPHKRKTAAIVIDSSNVILDLSGFELSQGNDVLETIGIVARTGHENITILGSDGIIKNFSQLGIYVQGGTKNISIGNDDAQLLVKNNGGKSAVSFAQAVFQGSIAANVLTVTTVDGGTIEDGMRLAGLGVLPGTIITGRGTGTGGTGTYFVNFNQNVPANTRFIGGGFMEGGIQLGELYTNEEAGFTTVHGIVNGATLNNVICDANSPVGLNLGNTFDPVFKNSSFSQNFDSRLSALFYVEEPSCIAFGILEFASPVVGDFGWTNMVLDTVRCNGNSAVPLDTSSESIAIGAFIGDGGTDKNEFDPLGKGLVLSNCEFNGNNTGISGFSTTRGFAIGASGGVVIENSQFCSNFGGNIVEGFHQSGYVPSIIDINHDIILQCKSIVLKDFIASNNFATTALWADNTVKRQRTRGFLTVYTDGLTIDGCVAQNNRAFSGGLADDDYSGRAMGFYITGDFPYKGHIIDGRNIALNNVHASGNYCDAAAGDALSMGIYFEDALHGSVAVNDTVITGNSFLEGDLGTRFDAGIVMLPFSDEIPNRLVSIKNSTIVGHRSAGVLAYQFPKTNVQNNEISENGVGVLLFGGCNCSSILNNTFLHNGEAVLDFDNPSTSLVANNQAFDNGIGSTGTTYDVMYPFGAPPTTLGDLVTSFPSLPTVDSENTEIEGSCGLSIVSSSHKKITQQIQRLVRSSKLDEKKALFGPR